MKGRSVLAHAILALGGLTLAYLVWTDDGPSREIDEVELVDCDADAVSRIELHTTEKDIVVTIEREGDTLHARATVTQHRENADDQVQSFVASTETLTTFLEELAPLRARRSLGELEGDDLAEVGLAEDPGRLVLGCGGESYEYEIGNRAYGSGDRYARATSGGPVYLIGSERLQPLESADVRLMERRLHTFEWNTVTALEVRGWGQEKRLLQRNRLDEANAEWVDATSPDRRNEVFGNWLARYPRMRVQRYLAADAEPGSDIEDSDIENGDAPAPEASIEFTVHGEDGELGRMELRRVDLIPPVYYVRTETTHDWVRVPASVAQGFEDDARTVLGLDAIERPQPEPPAPTESGETPDAGAGAATEAAPGAAPATPTAPASPPAAPASPHAPATPTAPASPTSPASQHAPASPHGQVSPTPVAPGH